MKKETRKDWNTEDTRSSWEEGSELPELSDSEVESLLADMDRDTWRMKVRMELLKFPDVRRRLFSEIEPQEDLTIAMKEGLAWFVQTLGGTNRLQNELAGAALDVGSGLGRYINHLAVPVSVEIESIDPTVTFRVRWHWGCPEVAPSVELFVKGDRSNISASWEGWQQANGTPQKLHAEGLEVDLDGADLDSWIFASAWKPDEETLLIDVFPEIGRSKDR